VLQTTHDTIQGYEICDQIDQQLDHQKVRQPESSTAIEWVHHSNVTYFTKLYQDRGIIGNGEAILIFYGRFYLERLNFSLVNFLFHFANCPFWVSYGHFFNGNTL
jgi:hypothetical protein